MATPDARESKIGRLIEWADNAPLPERVKTLEEEAGKLALLLDMSALFSSTKELDVLMSLVAEHTTRIMDCERSSVFLLDKEKNELYALVAQGLEVSELRFSTNSGLAGFTAREGTLLNIPDAYQDKRFNPAIDRQTGFRTTSVLAFPLRLPLRTHHRCNPMLEQERRGGLHPQGRTAAGSGGLAGGGPSGEHRAASADGQTLRSLRGSHQPLD